jgi:hypothetical protein
MRSRPAAIPQYLKSGRLAMFFFNLLVLFVPVGEYKFEEKLRVGFRE